MNKRVRLKPLKELNWTEWRTLSRFFRDKDLAALNDAAPIRLPLFMFRWMMRRNESGHRIGFGIITEEGLIGSVEFYDWHSVDTATLGIMLGKEYWGKGYGSEALELVLTWGFVRGIETVKLTTLNRNVRAQKTFKRLGFKETGKTQYEGTEFMNMELSKEDFKRLISGTLP